MRKSRKKALIAIARKIGTVVWNMLEQNKPYDPALIRAYDPVKVSERINYYQREIQRLQRITN